MPDGMTLDVRLDYEGVVRDALGGYPERWCVIDRPSGPQ
jgi:hypothetical protein